MANSMHQIHTAPVAVELAESPLACPACGHNRDGEERWVCAGCGAKLHQLTLF